MVEQILTQFCFSFSEVQPTPLAVDHGHTAPPSDEPFESNGPYPELVGCLITLGMGLVLRGKQPVTLTGFLDSSWADNAELLRSIQGYYFSLGTGAVRGGRLGRRRCEVEIYVGAMAAQELRWLTYLLTDLGERPRSPPELQQRGQLYLAYMASRANTTDVFTKALGSGDHQHFCTALGVLPTLPHLLVS
ncbi:unnamed protein product [Closterium sp. NIES-53]